MSFTVTKFRAGNDTCFLLSVRFQVRIANVSVDHVFRPLSSPTNARSLTPLKETTLEHAESTGVSARCPPATNRALCRPSCLTAHTTSARRATGNHPEATGMPMMKGRLGANCPFRTAIALSENPKLRRTPTKAP